MTMPEGSGSPAGGGFTNAPPPGAQYAPPPGPPDPSGQPGPPGPPSYAMPEQAPAKKSRSGLYALVVLVVLIVLIVGGLAFFRDRISGGVTELQVGDCIDEPSAATSVTDVQHQPWFGHKQIGWAAAGQSQMRTLRSGAVIPLPWGVPLKF